MIKMASNFLHILAYFVLFYLTNALNKENGVALDKTGLFVIEGKLTVRPEFQPKPNVFGQVYISLDYGRYTGFVKSDGSFRLTDIPTGSYIIEAMSVDYTFESLRIDITNKGKIRVRKLNLLQPNVVVTMPYPVKMTAMHPTQYFRKREEWRVTDVLMNPMIIMLIVAFLLMLIMPKMAGQDPQMQKEMQNLQLPKMDMPDMADMLANMFGGSSSKKGSSSARKAIAPQNTKRTTR